MTLSMMAQVGSVQVHVSHIDKKKEKRSVLMAHNIHFKRHYSSAAQGTSGLVTLKTTNSEIPFFPMR